MHVLSILLVWLYVSEFTSIAIPLTKRPTFISVELVGVTENESSSFILWDGNIYEGYAASGQGIDSCMLEEYLAHQRISDTSTKQHISLHNNIPLILELHVNEECIQGGATTTFGLKTIQDPKYLI